MPRARKKAAASDARLAPTTIKKRSRLTYDLMRFIRNYVVMSREQLLVVALWVMHTHAVRDFEQTPYLAVTSPEKQCGKSRLLEVLDRLVARPWLAILPSEAVLYRKIEADLPTLLLDEVGTIFNPRTADRYEPHRAVLNAGHRRGNKVPRCVGSSGDVIEFDPFCPKVLSGIGTLPETVADRSVPIRLARRTRDEAVARFLRRDVDPIADKMRKRIERTAKEHRQRLRGSRPTMPDELSDRMQEGCEPLVAIADALRIGTEARIALVALFSVERLDDQESMRQRLLADIRQVFERREARRRRQLKGIATTDLLDELYGIEEAAWASYYGRPLEPRDLASLLRHYGIRSQSIRVNGKPVKGYKRDALHDAWQRYRT